MSEVVFRPYREGDEVAINEAFNRVFGLRRSLEDWRWKYPEQPLGRHILLAFEEGGRLAAHYAVLPVPVQAAGRRVLAGQAVDIFSLRRRGMARRNLFVRLAEAFYRQSCRPDAIALLYGFPGERHFRLGAAQLGYCPPSPAPRWRRSAAPRSRWWPPWTGIRVREGFDRAAVERLWQRAAARYPVAALRDAAWIDRRFRHRPEVGYVHLGSWRRGRLEALAVVRYLGGSLHWAELVWDGRDCRCLEALDAEVGRRAAAERATGQLWLAGDPEAEATLAARGWRREALPEGPVLTSISFHPEIDAAEFAARLYVTMGDADLV